MSITVAALALALAAAMNLLLFQFSEAHFSAAFDPRLAAVPALRPARAALVFAQLATAPVIALGLVMLTPAVPRTRPAARIAGASRSAVALGESAPLLLAVALVVAAGGVGPTWFVASHQREPAAAFVAMTSTSVAFGWAAVALHTFVVTGVRAVGGSMVLARLTAVLVAFASVGAVLGDLLRATAGGGTSQVGVLAVRLWGAAADDLDAVAAVRALGIAVVAVVTVLLGRLLERDGGAFPHHPKLLALRSIGAPDRLVNGVARETLLLLRHPVGQTTTAAAIVMTVLVVLGTRSGLVPPAVAVSVSAMLFSANAETAFGRSAPTLWVRRLVGASPFRMTLEQYLGVMVPGAVLVLVSSTVIAVQVPDAPSPLTVTVVGALVVFVMLSAIAYLAGTLLPYDEAAPTAVIATSLVAVALEGAVLWLSAVVADPGTPLATVTDLCVAAGALVSAQVVVRRRVRGARR